MQHKSVWVKGQHRIIPKPIVVKVTVNQHLARDLLDLGLLGDFILTALVDQLQLTWRTLDTPLVLQLAVQESRSKVNALASAQLKY